MPTTVNVANGVPSAHLNPGDHFVWVNNTSNDVAISNCGGFCVASNYTVNKNSTSPAQVNQSPTNWSFSEDPSNTWNPGGPHPGLPHISNPNRPAQDKEVA
jgi:hypothetical protein